MNRDTFMKQLAYLLQDIDDDDRQDALGYYQDYFDEAGSEHETDIINELGSPERVASIVRTSLHSNPDANGEFTDSGYENERYKDPGHELARRMDLPETPFHNKGNFYGRFSSRPNEGQKAEEDAPQADSSYRSPKKYPGDPVDYSDHRRRSASSGDRRRYRRRTYGNRRRADYPVYRSWTYDRSSFPFRRHHDSHWYNMALYPSPAGNFYCGSGTDRTGRRISSSRPLPVILRQADPPSGLQHL